MANVTLEMLKKFQQQKMTLDSVIEKLIEQQTADFDSYLERRSQKVSKEKEFEHLSNIPKGQNPDTGKIPTGI